MTGKGSYFYMATSRVLAAKLLVGTVLEAVNITIVAKLQLNAVLLVFGMVL